MTSVSHGSIFSRGTFKIILWRFFFIIIWILWASFWTQHKEYRNILWLNFCFLYSVFSHDKFFSMAYSHSLKRLVSSLKKHKVIVIDHSKCYEKEVNLKDKPDIRKYWEDRKYGINNYFKISVCFLRKCFYFGYQRRLDWANSSGVVWPLNVTTGINAQKLYHFLVPLERLQRFLVFQVYV